MAIPLLDTRSLTDDVREALRLRAVAAREAGFPTDTVAAILGVRPETVSRWFTAYQRGGLEALPGDRTGRPVGSGRLLEPGKEAAGGRDRRQQPHRAGHRLGPVDPSGRAPADPPGVRPAPADPATVGEYLRRWGLTPQRPVRHAYRQDPEEVLARLEEEYPALAARAKAEGAEVQWGDENGVRSDAARQRGYRAAQRAPRASGARLPLPGEHDLNHHQRGQAALHAV